MATALCQEKKTASLIFLASLFLMGCATGPDTGPMAGQRYSLVQTQASRRAEQIFPVQIYRIDDKEIRDDRAQHKLEPGVHTLRARAVIERDLVPGLSRDLSRGGAQEITHNFQSGYRYFIGLKADGPRRQDWHLVIWKTEEVRAGTVSLDR